jgi:hypothetical protein
MGPHDPTHPTTAPPTGPLHPTTAPPNETLTSHPIGPLPSQVPRLVVLRAFPRLQAAHALGGQRAHLAHSRLLGHLGRDDPRLTQRPHAPRHCCTLAHWRVRPVCAAGHDLHHAHTLPPRLLRMLRHAGHWRRPNLTTPGPTSSLWSHATPHPGPTLHSILAIAAPSDCAPTIPAPLPLLTIVSPDHRLAGTRRRGARGVGRRPRAVLRAVRRHGSHPMAMGPHPHIPVNPTHSGAAPWLTPWEGP